MNAPDRNHLEALERENRELREALEKLANEADALRFIEEEIRAAAGHTNWSVLRKRIDDARNALRNKET